MSEAGAGVRTGVSAQDKTDRILSAIRPMVARAIEANNIRAGARFDDIEGNSAAVGDALARALMEAGVLEFARATDEEVAEARSEALKKTSDRAPSA